MDEKTEAAGLRAWQLLIVQIVLVIVLFLGLIRVTFRVRGMMFGYEVFILGMLMLLAFICLIGFVMHKKQPMFVILYWLALFDSVVLSALLHDVFLFGIVVAAFGILFSLRFECEERRSIRYSHSHEAILPTSGLSEAHHLTSPLMMEKTSTAKKIKKRRKKRARKNA